ncbi:hypothetical protein [Bacteroides pyogenes]|nr:hypothetical protein [Bacteroides pyogenes]
MSCFFAKSAPVPISSPAEAMQTVGIRFSSHTAVNPLRHKRSLEASRGSVSPQRQLYFIPTKALFHRKATACLTRRNTSAYRDEARALLGRVLRFIRIEMVETPWAIKNK